MSNRRKNARLSSSSWDAVADWYIGWVGARGSEYHRRLAIPATLDLLDPSRGQRIMDIGCGTAALAAHVTARGAHYTGIDSSRRLLAFARRHHGGDARFLHGDATRLRDVAGLAAQHFDAVVFLLSIQDIDPLAQAIDGAAWALRPGGKIVILMTHPCFRIPRQSGWGWDRGRRLQYRRVDRYLTPLIVPMKPYGRSRSGVTRSHHRPLEEYVSTLAGAGLWIERIREIPAAEDPVRAASSKAERRANREIPLFMAMLAGKHAPAV